MCFNCIVTKLKEKFQKMNLSLVTIYFIYVVFQLSCQCTYAKNKIKQTVNILYPWSCILQSCSTRKKVFKKETTLESTFLFQKNFGNMLSRVLWKYLAVAHLF